MLGRAVFATVVVKGTVVVIPSVVNRELDVMMVESGALLS